MVYSWILVTLFTSFSLSTSQRKQDSHKHHASGTSILTSDEHIFATVHFCCYVCIYLSPSHSCFLSLSLANGPYVDIDAQVRCGIPLQAMSVYADGQTNISLHDIVDLMPSPPRKHLGCKKEFDATHTAPCHNITRCFTWED